MPLPLNDCHYHGYDRSIISKMNTTILTSKVSLATFGYSSRDSITMITLCWLKKLLYPQSIWTNPWIVALIKFSFNLTLAHDVGSSLLWIIFVRSPMVTEVASKMFRFVCLAWGWRRSSGKNDISIWTLLFLQQLRGWSRTIAGVFCIPQIAARLHSAAALSFINY